VCHYTGVGEQFQAGALKSPSSPDGVRESTPPPSGTRAAAIELARTAAGGDVRATRRLLEIVAPRVARVVRAVMGSRHAEVEDAAQLALIGFVQALPSFRGECDPSQFAARIAVRTAGAVRRRSRSRGGAEDRGVDVDCLEAPREELDAARRREIIRSLLDSLPEEQGEVLVLRVMLGWALKEIAEATGAPLNTVRSRLRLAKEAVRRRISDDPSLAEGLDLQDGHDTLPGSIPPDAEEAGE
jgi:RNA polymerase sigma-70 factor (ECF subfamily)